MIRQHLIAERIEKRRRKKDELQGQLAIDMGKQVTFITPQIKAFLHSLKRGNVNDENNRRGSDAARLSPAKAGPLPGRSWNEKFAPLRRRGAKFQIAMRHETTPI